MLGKLLKKEFSLCLHPTVFLMMGLSCLVLVPNYPYTVSFFYLTLALFFICMNGRENHDLIYTLMLPVAKRDLVTARIAFAALLEMADLLCVALMSLLRGRLYSTPNAAGMEANLALLGEGLILFGTFHLAFFPSYYRRPERIGVPFLRASIAVFVLVALDIVLCYTVPLFRDALDTPDPAQLGVKLLFLAACALFYALATLTALRVSQRRLISLDLH